MVLLAKVKYLPQAQGSQLCGKGWCEASSSWRLGEDGIIAGGADTHSSFLVPAASPLSPHFSRQVFLELLVDM